VRSECVDQAAIARLRITSPYFDSVIDGSREDPRAVEIGAENSHSIVMTGFEFFSVGHDGVKPVVKNGTCSW
jgi:hypothetical protein